MKYRASDNAIVDETGKQIAVVLPTNCSRKLAHQLAAWAAERLSVHEAEKARRASQEPRP